MTDWDKDTGAGGTIRIRDTGYAVEFWFQAGYSSDWYNGLDFSWHANGSTTNKSINYPTGADWYKVGYANVSTSQTVTFSLETDTNISGIGGPASISHAIDRDTVPAAPSTPTISGIKSTSAAVSFRDGSNGGDAIDSRQIRYDNNSDASSATTVSSDGSTTITGLTPNTTYYVWARTHNSVGWSSWSGRASFKTVSVPTAPSAPLLSSVTATTVDVNWTDNTNGGSPITAHQISYGVSPLPDSNTIVSASAPQVVTGLSPGTVYNFAVRALNSTGWSAWSKVTSVRTVAGVRINVNGVWKLAVPYVNVAGVWKMAEAWTKNSGTWSRTF